MSDVCFRPFAGPADYPKMLAVLQDSKAADALDDADTLEGLAGALSLYESLGFQAARQDAVWRKPMTE
jgi:hypothetical protein